MLKRLKNALVLTLLLTSSSVFSAESEAIFGGGCFWSVEADFDKVPGVTSTVSGYDGGQLNNPTYKKVSSGTTNYVEVVKVTYEPNIVNYEQLLAYYWRHIDPTVKNRQFCDQGQQYRSVIFYLNDEQ